MQQSSRILVSAYAIHPEKGSEDGMGWNFVLQIARNHPCLVVTRKNNRPAIEAAFEKGVKHTYPINFIYYDLPYFMRFWKKGSRGAMLYYWLWQLFLPLYIWKERKTIDLVHNLNFHNDWTPTFLWALGKPLVWGPVGHHPSIPLKTLKKASLKLRIQEFARIWIKNYFWKFSPSYHLAMRNTRHLIKMNSKSKGRASIPFTVMPSVASEDWGDVHAASKGKFTVLSIGRLVPLKGFDLTLEAFSHFFYSLDEVSRENVELKIIGSGPMLEELKDRAVQLKLEKYCHFITWCKRIELVEHYKHSSCFLFPSHEGAGMVVAEALNQSLPVICLDNEGPGEFVQDSCGLKVSPGTFEETAKDLSVQLSKLYQDSNLLRNMSISARHHYLNNFTWKSRGDTLHRIYQSIAS